MFFKSIIIIGLTLTVSTLSAEFTKNPDSNTLWIEDGKNIKTASGISVNSWNSDNLKIESAPDGKGFTIIANNPKKYDTHRYVPINPEYPWLVYKISKIKARKGYTGFAIYSPHSHQSGQVANLRKGIFAIKFLKDGNIKKGLTVFRLDAFGLEMTFDYLKMVKEPANYVLAESESFKSKKSFSVGDTLKLTVKLEKPAEDVTLRFYNSYCMGLFRVNEQDKLQLKPINKDCKIWKAEVKIDSITGNFLNKKHATLMKATILGGSMQDTLWGTIPYSFKLK